MILIKLAKNKNKTIKEAYGKYYARPVVTETIGIDELAEHMASHNTPFSKGAIKGLLTDMVSCVKELVLQNKAVKIDNLAIFSIGIINKMGAASIKEWSLAKFVEGYRLRARATGKLSNTQLSLDANAKNAMDLLNSSESAAGDTTTGDTTQGGGTTGAEEHHKAAVHHKAAAPTEQATTETAWSSNPSLKYAKRQKKEGVN